MSYIFVDSLHVRGQIWIREFTSRLSGKNINFEVTIWEDFYKDLLAQNGEIFWKFTEWILTFKPIYIDTWSMNYLRSYAKKLC